MLRATANQLLPTTITGWLPRPSWYTENLGLKTFLQAMVETRFREQYEDALSVYFNEQEIAGLDIVTDGDARFTQDIGGQRWTSYPPFHMWGFDGVPKMAPVGGRPSIPPPRRRADRWDSSIRLGLWGNRFSNIVSGFHK